MFSHVCTTCSERYLIFPSQVSDIVNTEHGIVVTFTCWCGDEQSTVTGRKATRRPRVPAAA